MLTGVLAAGGFFAGFKGGVESAGFASSAELASVGVDVDPDAGAVAGAAAVFLFMMDDVTERRMPTKESPSEVRKKSAAQMAVSLLRKVTAPRPPKADVAAPPPRAAPIPASFPG